MIDPRPLGRSGCRARLCSPPSPELVEQASEGYTFGELLGLLDAKRRVATP